MEVAITCKCLSLSFGGTNNFAIQSKTNPIFFKNNLIKFNYKTTSVRRCAEDQFILPNPF